jgi:hypothetical protein
MVDVLLAVIISIEIKIGYLVGWEIEPDVPSGLFEQSIIGD